MTTPDATPTPPTAPPRRCPNCERMTMGTFDARGIARCSADDCGWLQRQRPAPPRERDAVCIVCGFAATVRVNGADFCLEHEEEPEDGGAPEMLTRVSHDDVRARARHEERQNAAASLPPSAGTINSSRVDNSLMDAPPSAGSGETEDAANRLRKVLAAHPAGPTREEDTRRMDWLEHQNAYVRTTPILPPHCGYSVRAYIDQRIKESETPQQAPTPEAP